MRGNSVLLIIGGGIAAYKSLELIRRLKERGMTVRTILTKAGSEFVTPLSVASLTGEKVFTDLFSLTDEAEMGHIQLSRSADLVVVAPATADLMAKVAGGLANDLASTALLATDKRVLMAPAMNVRMWNHAATQRNFKTLKNDGVLFIGPNDGEMACGEFGPGRMAEPLEIVHAIENALAAPGPLTGIEGAGDRRPDAGTARSGALHRQPLLRQAGLCDCIGAREGRVRRRRWCRDRSRHRGALARVKLVKVTTAREMLAACESGAAGRYRCVHSGRCRLAARRSRRTTRSRRRDDGTSRAVNARRRTPTSSRRSRKAPSGPQLVVGFAAETENVVAHAQAKLARKGCDWIVANDVSPHTGIMGGDRNTVHLITAQCGRELAGDGQGRSRYAASRRASPKR